MKNCKIECLMTESAEVKDNKKAWRYGDPVQTSTIRAVVDGSKDEWKDVKAFRILSFQVPDTEIGVQAVAMACGHGMPSGIDEYNVCYEDYLKLGLKPARSSGRTRFGKPVLAVSKQTAGYRSVWGGICDSYLFALEVDDQESDDATDFGHDIFMLNTNLRDGGILVQSSSSGAYVRAQKVKHTWTVELIQPVAVDGKISGRGYEAVFRSGFDYFCSKSR